MPDATDRSRYLTFLTEPDAAEILERAERTETYYPDTLAADVLSKKYLAPGETGPLDLWERVARELASVEEDAEYWYEEFFSILFDFKFVPGGRVMHGSGRDEAQRKPTLANCYVVPIEEDSLEGIYRCLSESAMVYRTGGGVGTDLSILRPKGAPVNATVQGSPGSTSFMNLLSESTNTVSQAGRRGALMLTMRVDHPDILDFVTIKNDSSRRKVQYANISVLITHAFMEAVLEDTDFDLTWGGEVFETVRARELWRRIIENAHASAEPGIIFWDTMKEFHNVEYANPLCSTNPCVTGDTLVYTNQGMIPIAQMIEEEIESAVALDSRLGAGEWGPASVPFETGHKPVFRLKTKEGFEVRVTDNQKMLTERGWIEAKDLEPGDELHVMDHKGGFGPEGTAAEGRVLGWLIGDGHITGESGHGAVLGFRGDDRALAPEFAGYVNDVLGQDPEAARYPVGVVDIETRDLSNVSSIRLRELVAEKYGVTAENKTDGLPLAAFRASEDFQRGLLQSLFTADGTIQGRPATGVDVRLTSISYPLLQDVQRMLLNFGIFSRIYRNRHPKRTKEIKGKEYECQAVHELSISRRNLGGFIQDIGFLTDVKDTELLNRLSEYQDRPIRKEKFLARFEELVPDGEETVYDLTEMVTQTYIGNGLTIYDCGEQPLAAYTACNLGSINLSKFVDADGEFDYEELAEVARTATRFLDDVIDYNMDNHALEKIKEAVASDRRVGLGITGLADALVKMGVKYDTEEALEAVDRMMETICRAAYQTSIDLAREKGAFPLYSWEGISGSKFIQSLPEDLREQIKQFGLRNSTVLTVPPVGTGSIVAQSSSGVEPIFQTSYKRRVKQDDGETFTEYTVYHPLIQELFGDDDELPEHLVTAHDIDPYFRVRMQGTIQRWVDSAISSTVNLPTEVDVETVADIYITAYKAGLKGITVYREGSREGVLVTNKKEAPEEVDEPVDISVDPVSGDPAPAIHGRRRLKPRPRPAITRGSTEKIRTGDGSLFVTINEDDRGLAEVFASLGKAGGSAAAQSEATCRLISLCLRSGLDPWAIVDQLKGISGPNPVWDNGELILSPPDAIGRALERYLERRGCDDLEGDDLEGGNREGGVDGERAKTGAATAETVIKAAAESENFQGPGAMPARPMASCPDCGSPVVNENACLTCKHCGWSKC